ncbi:hypothetical protein D3C76_1033960 [compost metagenome]
MRGAAQEGLKRRQVLDHRQAQVIGSKLDLGTATAQLHVGAPQQWVILLGRARVGQRRAVDHDASPGQPAQQADHQGEEGFFGVHPGQRIFDAGAQADHRAPALDRQLPANIAQEQRKVVQALAQGLFQGRLLDQPPADQGKAALGHAMAVEVEELVVQCFDQQQPQSCKRRCRYARNGRFQDRLIDTGLGQQRGRPLRLGAQSMEHGTNEINGDCIVFPHGGFRKGVAKNTSVTGQLWHRPARRLCLDSKPT